MRKSESGCIASNFIFRNVIKSLVKYFSGNKSKLCWSTSDDTKRKPNSHDKFKKDRADGLERHEKESGGQAKRGGDPLFRSPNPNRLQASHRATVQRFYQQKEEKAPYAKMGEKSVMIANTKSNIVGEANGERRNVIKIHNSYRGIIENYEKEKSTSRIHPVAQDEHSSLLEHYSRSLILFLRAISQQGDHTIKLMIAYISFQH